MADTKISLLPDAGTIADVDLLAVVQGGQTLKADVSLLKGAFGDVKGVSVSLDNAVCTFDGVSGKLIQECAFLFNANVFKTADSGTASTTVGIDISSGENTFGTPSATGGVSLSTGPSAGGVTGDVTLDTGLTVGVRGVIRIKGGSQGTSGHVLQSSDTDGAVEWAPVPPSPPPALAVITVTVNHTNVLLDDVILCDGTLTVTLLPSSQATKVLQIKNIGVGTVTIAPAGAETIDGQATVVIPPSSFPNPSVSLISDGFNRFIR